MFTGLVQALAPIVHLDGHSLGLEWPSELFDQQLEVGESIAVNGCCLTVAECGSTVRFDLSPETLERTTFSRLTVGGLVNVERALRAGQPIGGHFVQGHIDGVGQITKIEQAEDSIRIGFLVPETGSSLLVDKGSIALDGISLTVIEPKENLFEVAIVPHTWQSTNLRFAKVGTPVNVEFDMLAKHIQRLLTFK